MAHDDWQRGVDKRLNDIERKDAVREVHHANVESRLAGIEDTLKWLVRLIIGAVIVAVVGFALNGGFNV